MKFAELVGIEKPINRLHYTYVTFAVPVITITACVLMVLVSQYLFIPAVGIIIFGKIICIQATGNRLKDAQIDENFKWLTIVPTWGLFLYIFLMFKPTKKPL